MTPTCSHTDTINGVHYYCDKDARHSGRHELLPDHTKKNYECGAAHKITGMNGDGETLTCKRYKVHDKGPDRNLHFGYDSNGNYRSWRTTEAGVRVGGYQPAGTVHPAESYGHPAGRAFGKTGAWQQVIDEQLKAPLFGIPTPQPETHPVPLTVEDLKVIAYYLSVIDPEDDKEDMEVKAKIDKALKAHL